MGEFVNHEGKTEAALSMLAAVPADDAPAAIGTSGPYIYVWVKRFLYIIYELNYFTLLASALGCVSTAAILCQTLLPFCWIFPPLKVTVVFSHFFWAAFPWTGFNAVCWMQSVSSGAVLKEMCSLT